ncbi:MAG: trimethylamine methyltransferase family protein [Spirochaetia bacterium]
MAQYIQENQKVLFNIPSVKFNQPVLTWDDDTVKALVTAAVMLASKTGLNLPDDDEGVYLKEAESKGAKISLTEKTVYFTEEQLRDTLDVIRKTAPVRKPLRGDLKPKPRDRKYMVGNSGNLLFDSETWEAKAPGSDDLIDFCSWIQGDNNLLSMHAPMTKDTNQMVGPMYDYALSCKYCRKTVKHQMPVYDFHVKHLYKMDRIVEKHRGYFTPMYAAEYVNPPFKLSKRTIDCMLSRYELGALKENGIWMGSMTIGGMSAPVTVAGAAVQAFAETLAALAFFHIIRPESPLRMVMATGSADLRTGNVDYFSMRTHLQNTAVWEMITRGVGAMAPYLTWYRDVNEPGLQAVYELTMGLYFFQCTSGQGHPSIGQLDNGNSFSPQQAIMDIEVLKEFDQLTGGFDVNDEILGLEEMIKNGFEGDFLGSEHTVQYMQEGIPYSSFFFRGLPGTMRHNKNKTQTQELMDKAWESVKKSKQAGREIEPDHELAGELYEVVKEAAGEIGIAAPELK